MSKKIFITLLSVTLLSSCTFLEEDLFDPSAERTPIEITDNVNFADASLTQETQDLHTRLQDLTQRGIMIGQQSAFGGRIEDFDFNAPIEERFRITLNSDFASVSNDLPAVIGVDFEAFTQVNPDFPTESELRRLNFLKNSIVEAHRNGIIITLSWHMTNPVTLGNAFDVSGQAVAQMLQQGSVRDTFVTYLRNISVFFNDLKDAQGNAIPVLFRPWHEMNGDFFYWGNGHRTAQQYKQLYQDTVRILTDDFGVHNLLYVYSPNWVSSREEYLENYPGDDYVDVLGVDVYDFRDRNFLNSAIDNLQIVEEIAKEKNMLFALTETGLENVTKSNWWTERLYKAIRSSSASYAMLWRNGTFDHFYVPFEAHNSADNFREFIAKDDILLNSDTE